MELGNTSDEKLDAADRLKYLNAEKTTNDSTVTEPTHALTPEHTPTLEAYDPKIDSHVLLMNAVASVLRDLNYSYVETMDDKGPQQSEIYLAERQRVLHLFGDIIERIVAMRVDPETFFNAQTRFASLYNKYLEDYARITQKTRHLSGFRLAAAYAHQAIVILGDRITRRNHQEGEGSVRLDRWTPIPYAVSAIEAIRETHGDQAAQEIAGELIRERRGQNYGELEGAGTEWVLHRCDEYELAVAAGDLEEFREKLPELLRYLDILTTRAVNGEQNFRPYRDKAFAMRKLAIKAGIMPEITDFEHFGLLLPIRSDLERLVWALHRRALTGFNPRLIGKYLEGHITRLQLPGPEGDSLYAELAQAYAAGNAHEDAMRVSGKILGEVARATTAIALAESFHQHETKAASKIRKASVKSTPIPAAAPPLEPTGTEPIPADVPEIDPELQAAEDEYRQWIKEILPSKSDQV
jgi:hypothetical protein